ncbi:hypothetical protein MKZ38_003790 [Zalerion maritima]|uniref:Uncharacterized protein n=1 Tax=Zalerion maritima TaxID=339359 RepID=A0AAD5RNP7_9PEZI|nr:hypothetical protein MKZ38_003790 [Zalerion maritima]
MNTAVRMRGAGTAQMGFSISEHPSSKNISLATTRQHTRDDVKGNNLSDVHTLATGATIVDILEHFIGASIVAIIVFAVRKSSIEVTGSTAGRKRGVHMGLMNFGHKIMGRGTAFAPVSQKQPSTGKLYDLESSGPGKGSSCRSPSPNMEMEPMLTPEPVAVRHFA